MKGFMKKSMFILCGLLLSIILIGQFADPRGDQANVPVVSERVLVPGGQSIGEKWM